MLSRLRIAFVVGRSPLSHERALHWNLYIAAVSTAFARTCCRSIAVSARFYGLLDTRPVTKRLDISFDNIPLRTLCEDPKAADAKYNPAVATALRGRLADLAAAATVSDLPPVGNPRPISIDEQAQYMLDLPASYTLHFCSAHVKTPRLATGEIDWSKVSRIKILAIK